MSKRLFDIIISSIGLILLGPVLLTIAVLVRCFLGSPILFVQSRPGLRGKPFKMIKFRTMVQVDHEAALVSDADRMTGLGKALRASSLDELPELWNVMRGDMSIVGPRPLLIEYLPLYTTDQYRRHDVRPGITGWAQINGRNALSWEEKFEFDVWYVENHSLLLDLKILLLTLKKVLSRDGISAPGEATVRKFTGTKS